MTLLVPSARSKRSNDLLVALTAAISIAVVLMLSGCRVSDQTIGEGNNTVSASYMEQYADDLAQSLGIASPPPVEIVRVIRLDEWANTQVDCLRGEGFDVQLTQDGQGVEAASSMDEALFEASRLARYICQLAYPVAQKYMEPLSEERLQVLYDYRVIDLVRCLESEGHSGWSSPPSRQVFVESGGLWSPFEGLDTLTAEQYGAIAKECPQTPVSIYEKE